MICDSRVNPAAYIDSCEFHLLIGFAAVRRREFHSFRIAHSASGSKVTPASLNLLNFAQFSPAELAWVDRLASQLKL